MEAVSSSPISLVGVLMGSPPSLAVGFSVGVTLGWSDMSLSADFLHADTLVINLFSLSCSEDDRARQMSNMTHNWLADWSMEWSVLSLYADWSASWVSSALPGPDASADSLSSLLHSEEA